MTVGCREDLQIMQPTLDYIYLELRVRVYGPYWMGKGVACVADIADIVGTKIQEILHTDDTLRISAHKVG